MTHVIAPRYIGPRHNGLVQIENSALYNNANNESLTHTRTSAPTSTKSGTLFAWLNPTSFPAKGSAGNHIFNAGGATGDLIKLGKISGELTVQLNNTSSGLYVSNRQFRDTSFGLLTVAFDTSLPNAGDRCRVYWNNDEITSFSTETHMSLDYSLKFNANSETIALGNLSVSPSTSYAFDGYMANIVWIDGLQLTPSSVAEADGTGLYWTPKSSDEIKSLSFGNNGFYLDNATNAETDASGNGNNFTNNNTVVTSKHTPTNIQALLNPLDLSSNASISNGNRTSKRTGGADITNRGTLAFPSSGKWYFEITMQSSNNAYVGITNENQSKDLGMDYSGAQYLYLSSNGKKYHTTTNGETYGDTWTTNDIIGVAYDADDGKIWWSKNNTWQATGNPSTGANEAYAGIDTSRIWTPCHTGPLVTSEITVAFADDELTDTPPSDFKTLNTTNIAAATTRIVSDPYEHWNNVLYTGNGTAIGSGGNSVTGVGFQPEFVWTKCRSFGENHKLHASLMGDNVELIPNDTHIANTVTEGLDSLDADGFTVGSNTAWNKASNTFVAWCAKLGGTPTTDNVGGATPTSGSIYVDGAVNTDTLSGSIHVKRLSVNTSLGMSVGTFDGQNTAGTIDTGLTNCRFIVIKRTNATYNWGAWHEGLTDDYNVYLNENNNQLDSDYFDTSENTASVVGLVGNSEAVNKSGGTFVFLAFSESEFISIGSYEGNANTDGAFVPMVNSIGVPLQPIWTLIKNIDSISDWVLFDVAREPGNVATIRLMPNLTDSDRTTTTNQIDIVSGGIKARATGGDVNTAETFSYLTIGIPTIDVDGRVLPAR